MRRGDRIDRDQCEAWDCDRPQHSKLLCLMHYKRAARGIDVRTRPEKVVGDPSGHGTFGVIDDDGETVLCHECGERRVSVGSHLAKAHGISAAEYRVQHGLGKRARLVSAALRATQSEAATNRLGTAGWERFEAKRDPAAASAARDMDEIRIPRPAVQASRAELSAARGRASRKGRVFECVMCGAHWCQVGGARQPDTCSFECWSAWEAALSMQEAPANTGRDSAIRRAHAMGSSYRSLAAEYGVTTARIRQIVRAGAIPETPKN